MKLVAGLVLLLANVRLSRCCYGEGAILFCLNIPPAFSPGYSSVVMALSNVGEINSTVLRSDDVSSVTRLRIDNAGVTGIAEGAFSSFQSLTNLSLNQNLLTEINPNWFGRPDILSELRLAGNQIEVVNESMLNGLGNIATLSLNKNRIRTIDPNSFSSQTVLAELDLSDNRMTRVSPQVFRSLRSTRIRLDGNPWDCSCGAEDFVDFLKDLHNKSLLDKPLDVICESPASLSGRPVWNVSVCVTSPPPRPPPVTQTVQPKPTDVLTTVPTSSAPSTTSETEISVQPKPTDTTVPASSAKVVTSPSQTTSETKTSVPPKPTDVLTTVPTSPEKVAPTSRTETSVQPNTPDGPITSSHTASPPSRTTSATEMSVEPKPTDVLTTVMTTATSVTPPPSVTEISVHPKPPDQPITVSTPTETCAASRPSSDTNTVCVLVVVIAILSSLLFVACFLAVLHRKKRSNKTVTPGRQRENRNEAKEDGSGSSRAPERENSENTQWDSETGRRRCFTGVRANKSANAVLFTAPFCAHVKDRATLQTETESEDAEKQRNETEGDRTNTTDVTSVDEKPLNADAVPYLSIGTNQSKPCPDDFNTQSTDGQGQRSQMGKVMGRISTWPPTAMQWQARCKMKDEESDAVWAPGDVKKTLNQAENPSGSDRDKKEEEPQTEDPRKVNVARMKSGQAQSSEPDDQTTSFSEAHVHTEEQLKEEEPNSAQEKQNQDPKLAGKSINKAEQRNEPKRAAMSRQKPENRSSKAPSGGASPDDETLLSGNEYAFMDLLHEVVQNNGRWTRERWKQIHVNRQRR